MHRLTRGERVPLAAPSRPGERWSMDFMLDSSGMGADLKKRGALIGAQHRP